MGGRRGRLIPLEERKMAVLLITEAFEAGARLFAACEILGIHTRTYLRWKNGSVKDRRKGTARNIANKLTYDERQEIIKICCLPQYRDLNPYEIYVNLLEEGVYLASVRTIYRVLKADGLLHHRSNTRSPRPVKKPEQLIATGINQVWCWDITYLKTDIAGIYYFKYTVIDIWNREIAGWTVSENESPEVAEKLFKQLSAGKEIAFLRLHSDNGNAMKGGTMLMTLYSLGITPSFSRPRVSDDNPYIESFFKTMKYHPSYPRRFSSIEEARKWCTYFVDWYNTVHRHSGIGWVTPEQRRLGIDSELFRKRNDTLMKAYIEKPERFKRPPRLWEKQVKVILHPVNDKIA